MAFAFRVDVEGVDRLIRAIRKLKIDGEKILKQALGEAGKIILVEARAIAPTRTGRFKRTLKLRRIRRSRKLVGFVVQTGTRPQLRIDNDAPGYYPMSLEFGFVHYRSLEYVSPKPTLRPALENKRKEAIDVVINRLERGLIKDHVFGGRVA